MRHQGGHFRAIDLPPIDFATGLTPSPERGFLFYPQASPVVKRAHKRSYESIIGTEGALYSSFEKEPSKEISRPGNEEDREDKDPMKPKKLLKRRLFTHDIEVQDSDVKDSGSSALLESVPSTVRFYDENLKI